MAKVADNVPKLKLPGHFTFSPPINTADHTVDAAKCLDLLAPIFLLAAGIYVSRFCWFIITQSFYKLFYPT